MITLKEAESIQGTATHDWVIERRNKDGTSDFEFKYAISEDMARDYAQALLGSSAAIDFVLVFKYHGKVSRVETVKWE